MALSLRELREQIAAKDRQIEQLGAVVESRGFTPEEKTLWDQYMDEHAALEGRIAVAEKVVSLESRSRDDDRYREEADRHRFEQRRKAGHDDDPNRPLTAVERSKALACWLQGVNLRDSRDRELCRRAGLDPDVRTAELFLDRGTDRNGVPLPPPRDLAEVRQQSEYRRESRERQLRDYESRADNKINLTTAGIKDADGSLGGYVVPDEGMRPLETALLQWDSMRSTSKIISTATGADLPIPTNNDTANKGEIIAENTAVNQLEVTFGQVVLGSYKYSSKMVNVSVELLQDAMLNFPAFLGEVLGTRIGRITQDHFTVGTGTSQPRGIVTAAVDSTFLTGAAQGVLYPNLMDLIHSVDPAYRSNARLMMNDSVLKMMKKMVDGENRPIWQQGLIGGAPATIDGYPYTINQSMVSTAAGKCIIFGDLSTYVIREVRGITLLRLDERYAEKHQVAFLAFARYDGDLVNAGTNPVKYMTMTT